MFCICTKLVIEIIWGGKKNCIFQCFSQGNAIFARGCKSFVSEQLLFREGKTFVQMHWNITSPLISYFFTSTCSLRGSVDLTFLSIKNVYWINYIFIIDFTCFICHLGFFFFYWPSAKHMWYCLIIYPEGIIEGSINMPSTFWSILSVGSVPAMPYHHYHPRGPSKVTMEKAHSFIDKTHTHTSTLSGHCTHAVLQFWPISVSPTPHKCTTALLWAWFIHTAYCHNEMRSHFSH